MKRVACLALLLCACAAPRGPWVVQGVASREEEIQALALAEAARRVLPDAKDWLSAGGTIYLSPDISWACPVPTGRVAAGCSEPGAIFVLWPHPRCGPAADLTCSALAHELAHLGLAKGGGVFGGPVDLATEDQADAGALLVVQEYRRSLP